MAIRELLLSLGVEVDKSGVNNADKSLGKMKKAAIAAAAAFAAIKSVQALNSMVDGVRELGDEIDKTSSQLGVSTDALQEWRFAAGLAGASGQEMSNSLAKLQKNAVDAADGGTAMAEGFEKLGVNVLDANGEVKDADTLLTEMADGFARVTNDAQRSAIAQELMGRAGKKLIPLLKGGSKAIEDMRREAQDLGGVMSEDLIASTVELTDDQFRAQQAWQGVKNDIAQALIPIYLKLAHAMRALARLVRAVLKPAFQIFGNILSVFTDGAEILNETFDGLGTTLLSLVPILGALGLAVSIFGAKSVMAGIRTAIAWALAFLPFLLMMAGIALLLILIDDVITFFKGGDSMIGRLLKSFKKWVKEMGGFSGAVGKMFETLMKRIFGVSDDTARTVGGVFAALGAVLKAIFVDVPTVIAEAFAAAYIFVRDFAEDFVRVITDAIDFVVGKFEELTDAVADAIGEVADFVGIDEDEGLTANRKNLEKLEREGKRERKAQAQKRVAILKQLDREGFGTFTRVAETETASAGTQLTGAKAGAQERFAQLSQDINAPLTVNVDATNRDDAGAVGRVVGGVLRKEAFDFRPASQNFVTNGGS